MKQKCIRCVVRLSLAELHWEDGSTGTEIHLEGPPVFVRACILGQLQHSHLHRPAFPVRLDQDVNFDRVLTNCKNPALFTEVIRGEHVKIELIQVSPDYKGGKILARFETTAHDFLFPESSPENGELRVVMLNKSRKYESPPRISFTTSTTLLEAIVQSPVDSIFKQPSTTTTMDAVTTDRSSTSSNDDSSKLQVSSLVALGGPESAVGDPQHGTTRRVFTSFPAATPSSLASIYGKETLLPPMYSEPLLRNHSAPAAVTTPETRLHSLLSSYRPQHKDGSKMYEDTTKPIRVKFKPPVPKFTPHTSVTKPFKQGSFTKPPYTSGVGLHSCPQRYETTERHRSTSVPNLSATRSSHCHKSSTLPNHVPIEFLRLDPVLVPRGTAPDLRPPFVVRHTDPKMIEKRDFCVYTSPRTTRHFTKRNGPSSARSEEQGEVQRVPSIYLNDSSQDGGVISPQDTKPVDHYLNGQKPSPSNHTHKSLPTTYKPKKFTTSSKQTSTASFMSSPHSTTPYLGVQPQAWFGEEGSSRDLVSKYLLVHPGNIHRGEESPSKLIEEKLQKVMKECCECKRTCESLGEDSLTEDLERLRASLAAEREETLNRTAKFIPDQSLTVKLGPRDYWSQRISEFTGRPHRVIFNETMERLYSRLYEEASTSQ